MGKNKNKFVGVLKYIGKTISLTLLTILIIIGLALLFVFVTAKVAKSKNAEPPINLYTIISPSMTPNIAVYDVVVTVKTDLSKLKVRDVISYYSDNPAVNGLTITHRIVKITKVGDEYIFETKGDYNPYVDEWIVKGEDVVGRVNFKIPQLGKVQFFLGSKGGWLLAILIPALAIIAYDIYKIIKLILIKQRIAFYQKEGTESNKDIQLVTTSDIYKEEKPIAPSMDATPMNEPLSYEHKEEPVTSSSPYESEKPEEIINIEEDNIVKSFDEQVKIINEWEDKISDKN